MTDLSNLYLPSTKQIRRLCADIRIMATRADKDGVTDLDRLEEALCAGRVRVNAPGPEKDGYPSATMGGVGGHRTILCTDEHGVDDAVPCTAVEAMAIELATDGYEPPSDVVAQDVEIGCDMLRQSADSLRGAITRMNHLHRVSTPKSRGEVGGIGSCTACGTLVTGAASDRLRAGYCDPCRKAWDRAGRPDRAEFARTRKPVVPTA